MYGLGSEESENQELRVITKTRRYEGTKEERVGF